jgi:undecaprenyl pyrophosphate phosphatase UppP
MVAYLNKHGMQIFGYYRIALAIVVAALILGGLLSR